MTQTKNRPRPADRRSTRRTSAAKWAGFVVAPLAVAILVALAALTGPNETSLARAVQFELTTSNGQTISLEETLATGDALLYFSMGVGCDGCFAQIPELDAAMAERGLTLLPIMVDPAPMVAAEAARFGIERPILIDPGAQVSEAYGMVGVYGHGDRPSHSFALVGQSGEIAWVRHYAEMFVPAETLLSELDAARQP